MNNLIIIFLLTFLPLLELRASIPYGILVLKMNWAIVFIVAILSNILLGIILYLFLEHIIGLLIKIGFIKKLYMNYVERTQKKIHVSVEKYGEWGVAMFIGIPLPMTGVYSGALASYLIGLNFKKFIIANIIGVLIAGIIVTIVTLSGLTAFNIFIKKI